MTLGRGWRIGLALFALFAMIAAGCQSDSAVQDAVATPAPEPTATAVPAPTAVPLPTTAPPETEQPVPVATMPPATPTPTPEPPSPPVAMAELVNLSTLEPVACPEVAQADGVECSIATVPRDVDWPDTGEFVELMLAFVDNGDPNDAGPVVFLQGGPGAGSIQNARSFVGSTHDVLFVDQRGTGFSTPKLSCGEVDELWEAQLTNDPDSRLQDGAEAVTAAYFTCAERLRIDQGLDLNHFNTRAAAVDIEIIRQLYGHETWTLWGISYGTRLGLTVMRDHPEGVRAAVLDSVVPFEVDFFATIPAHGLRSIEAIDAACDRTDCAEEHGDFYDNLAGLVQRLNDEPVVITATRARTGVAFPLRVDGEELINMVFTQLYSTRSLRSLPRQISRADAGGLEEIVSSYVSRRDPQALDLSIGLYYTTWCREEIPFYDATIDDDLLESLEADFGPAAAGALSSDGSERFCDAFEVRPSNQIDDDPFVSDIPTLVFAGAFDPITPPAWSKQVADSLTNATYVEMANHGHGMTTACPANIRLAFLIDPTSELDITCAEESGLPSFD